MKTKIYTALVLLLAFSSCEVLDVQPYHSIPADEAITNAQQVESAVLGCYDGIQSDGYYGLNYLIYGDLSADNLNHVGITVTWSEFDNNNLLADNGLIEDTWASIYAVLNRVNNVLDKMTAIDNNRMTDQAKKVAEAELRFIRAMCHFDLMRLFGPVPIRISSFSNDEAFLNPGRNSVAEVLAVINDDLNYSIEHASSVSIRGRASKSAAHALKARVALYQYYLTQNTAYLEEAVSQSTIVIDDPNTALESDYSKLFSLEPTAESLFELVFNEQDRNLIARYYAHTTLAGRYEFSPTEVLINSYEPSDVRKNVCIKYAGSAPYVVKYFDISAGSDPVHIIRLAEMYLIRAEAASLLQNPIEQILADINIIRQRAGLEPVIISSYTALMIEIENQRQKEFAFEGHRWFDLVRTGRAIDVIGNVNSINQTLFPIPQAEIIANNNPDMYQNDGY